nr:MAG TPA: hypothetical protein [Caudoviricetes sp.]
MVSDAIDQAKAYSYSKQHFYSFLAAELDTSDVSTIGYKGFLLAFIALYTTSRFESNTDGVFSGF